MTLDEVQRGRRRGARSAACQSSRTRIGPRRSGAALPASTTSSTPAWPPRPSIRPTSSRRSRSARRRCASGRSSGRRRSKASSTTTTCATTRRCSTTRRGRWAGARHRRRHPAVASASGRAEVLPAHAGAPADAKRKFTQLREAGVTLLIGTDSGIADAVPQPVHVERARHLGARDGRARRWTRFGARRTGRR